MGSNTPVPHPTAQAMEIETVNAYIEECMSRINGGQPQPTTAGVQPMAGISEFTDEELQEVLGSLGSSEHRTLISPLNPSPPMRLTWMFEDITATEQNPTIAGLDDIQTESLGCDNTPSPIHPVHNTMDGQTHFSGNYFAVFSTYL